MYTVFVNIQCMLFIARFNFQAFSWARINFFGTETQVSGNWQRWQLVQYSVFFSLQTSQVCPSIHIYVLNCKTQPFPLSPPCHLRFLLVVFSQILFYTLAYCFLFTLFWFCLPLSHWMWLSNRHRGPSRTTPKSQFQLGPSTVLCCQEGGLSLWLH